MAGFGFGFGSFKNSSARFAALGQGSTVLQLSPGRMWTGVAGSGFATSPVDPPRSTAKPMLRLMVPPNQYYTDELWVGVMAGANDGGNLLGNMGLKEVIVHFEGASWTIDTPSFQTFADVNGIYRTYFGWWTLLRHDGRNGHAQVYFEAVPNDAAMQNRVIGPYQFSPQPKLHEATITVAKSGGADFQSIDEALAQCRSQALNNPLITITEAADYDIADSGQAYEGQGYCTITAAVPGVRIAKPDYSTDAAAVLRSRFGGLRFKGAELTIDMNFISEIYSESSATRAHWLDGCTIVNTGGQGALWRGGIRPVPWMVRDGAWFTECQVENCSDAFMNAKLVRGTTAINGSGDLYSGCPMVAGNVATGHRSNTSLAIDVPALSIRYTGAAATATIELTGANALASRTVVVKIAGNADRSFTLHKAEAAFIAGTNYSLQNLVDWLNTIPGVSATLMDAVSGRAAAWLSLAGLNGREFTARDFKSAPLTLVTYIDVISNWWHDAGLTDNAIIWGNLAVGVVGGDFNLSSSTAKRDLLIANNAIQNEKGVLQTVGVASQFNGANSHVVVAHNTLSTQAVTLRTDAEYSSTGYNLVANNSLRGLTWGGSAEATPIVNNHIHAGQSVPPSASGHANVVGTTIGGNEYTLYADDRAGDFRAKGELLSHLAPTILRYNGVGDPFAANAVKGAFDAAPADTVLTASSVTQQGITWTFDQAYPVGQYANDDWWVVGPVTITSITPASTVTSGNFGNGTPFTGREVNGAMVNPGNRSFAPGGLLANNSGNPGQSAPFVKQGYDSLHLPSFTSAVLYNDSFNVDPGNTGQPLVVVTGSVVKSVAKPTPAISGRPTTNDMAVLTVVDQAPPSNSIRPGISKTDKTATIQADDFDLSVFKNFPIPAGAPSYTSVLAGVTRMFETSWPDCINSGNIHPSNNHPEYGREIAKKVHDALLYLHLAISTEEKRDLLMRLAALATDLSARAEEGGVVYGAGGGQTWKHPVLAVVAAALGPNCPAGLLASTQANSKWGEDQQVFTVTGTDVGIDHTVVGDGRPRVNYAEWMIGGNEWGEQHPWFPGRDGSNWNAAYRSITGCTLYGGVLAVRLTSGAEALWNNPALFDYYLGTYWHYELVRDFTKSTGDLTNSPPAWHEAFDALYRPPISAPPAVASARINGDLLWLSLDKALDDASVPPASSFAVYKGATPIAVTAVEGVWRNNVGLRLASAVVASDVVTLAYSVGSPALRSVDQVNFPATGGSPIAVTNITPSVGGQNAAYPIVKFTAANPDLYGLSANATLDDAPYPRGSLWLPLVRRDANPATLTMLFGSTSGGPGIRVNLETGGRLNLILRNTAGSILTQVPSLTLPLGKDTGVLYTWDTSQPTHTAGAEAWFYDWATQTWSNAKGPVFSWSPNAAGVGWTNTTSIAWRLGGGGGNYDNKFGGLWLNTRERITVPAQRDKLVSKTNGSLDIGTLGEGITGTRPAVFIIGDSTQYNDPAGINRGTAPKFFRQAGGVLDLVASSWR